jgi:putative hydrolase of the HAD superfamily
VLFDLGDTLIYERVDDQAQLHELPLRLRPDACEVLDELSRRYRLALVTDTETSSEHSVRQALRMLGIAAFFDAVVTSIDVGVRKPDPQIFLEALRRVDARPSEAAMIGNDPLTDISGANGIGVITILYTPTKYFRAHLAADADYVVESLANIPPLLDDLPTCSTDMRVASPDG